MLVYGEPGTFKTRRALQMPYCYMWLILNVTDHGDLVDPENNGLRTKSYRSCLRLMNCFSSYGSGTLTWSNHTDMAKPAKICISHLCKKEQILKMYILMLKLG